jgi:hypothetical protein
MIRVRNPKGKTEVTLGNFRMVIDKDVSVEAFAYALEALTNNYTRTQEAHQQLLSRFSTLLMDYGDLKKKLGEDDEDNELS